MSATKTAAEVPSEVDAELQEAIRRAMSGVRDPEEMRKACERMDRMRKEVRAEEGGLGVAITTISRASRRTPRRVNYVKVASSSRWTISS